MGQNGRLGHPASKHTPWPGGKPDRVRHLSLPVLPLTAPRFPQAQACAEAKCILAAPGGAVSKPTQ